MISVTPDQYKRPRSDNWTDRGNVPIPGPFPIRMYANGAMRVSSSVERAYLPDGSGMGPMFHLSVSLGGKRASEKLLLRTLRDFDMLEALEDTTHPSPVQQFWLACDPSHRLPKHRQREAPCPYGDMGGQCKGCILESAYGTPCPTHRASTGAPT